MQGTANQIAFARSAKGFVAINNDGAAWNASLQTMLPAGTYCILTQGQLNAAGTACPGGSLTVGSNGVVTVSIPGNNGASSPAVALHINQKVGTGNLLTQEAAVANVWERNQATTSGNRQVTTVGCGQPVRVLDAGSFAF